MSDGASEGMKAQEGTSLNLWSTLQTILGKCWRKAKQKENKCRISEEALWQTCFIQNWSKRRRRIFQSFLKSKSTSRVCAVERKQPKESRGKCFLRSSKYSPLTQGHFMEIRIENRGSVWTWSIEAWRTAWGSRAPLTQFGIHLGALEYATPGLELRCPYFFFFF